MWVVLISATLAAVADDAATTPPTGERQRRYPPKTARQLFTDADIATARANIARFPAAREVADKIIAAADNWLEWSDADLAGMVTPGAVPRAFDVSAGGGCPHCGQEIYKFGTYPWIIDPKKPFKLTCPVDGTIYPSNDYETYYKSGFKVKQGWDTAFVDDGWGWKSPSGEKFWFVAHYNQRLWKDYLAPGVRSLGRAYLLTGDKRYAHKAAVLLHRFAQVYPGMDYNKQSRYGQMQTALGNTYKGKSLNRVWETSVAKSIAESYDIIWDTLDSDSELQRFTGKSSPQIRSFIEANLLEDEIDAYFTGQMRGNFGMHQSALVYLMLSRQTGENEKWRDDLMNRSGDVAGMTGLNFALYNSIYRDGVPFETAPGYNFGWVSNLTQMANPLQKTGLDLFKLPRMASFYEAPLDLINIGQFTPDLGDSGSVYGGLVGQSADVYQTAYRNYGDARYARFLASFGATGDAGFRSFDALFSPPIVAEATALPPQKPRLLDGYGMGILSNPADTVSASLFYGFGGGHGHADRLQLQIFGANQSLLPDLGYPDAANAYEAGRYTWSRNTIAHNTVTVDAAQQSTNLPGTVHLFASSPFARVIDVDANRTYAQCDVYRRRLVMVDAGENQSYYLDTFDVSGGAQHDYSLHGPPGQFEMLNGALSVPQKGTLAGVDVATGDIYDDAALRPRSKGTVYSSYRGSGFQHLFNVQRLQGAPNTQPSTHWIAQWKSEKDSQARLRVRILPQPGQEIIVADARVSPLKPTEVKFLIARRQTPGQSLSSRFVSVLEPFASTPFITDARQIPLDGGDGLAVEVQRTDGFTDVITHNPSGSTLQLRRYGLSTDARTAVITLNAAGRVTRVFFAGGSYLDAGGKHHIAASLPSGVVTAIEPAQRLIHIQLQDPQANFETSDLVGRIVHFENEAKRNAHPIVAAKREGDELMLTTGDDLLVGRAHLTGVGGEQLQTDTALVVAPTYLGAFVTDPAQKIFFRLRSAKDGVLQLNQPLPKAQPFQVGQNVWLTDVGPGDRLDAPQIYSWAQ